MSEGQAPEMREIATTRDGRDITRGYVDPLAIMLPQDPVLLTRGGGNYELYREVLRDDQVAAVCQQRRLAVVSKEWEVQPGGKAAKDKAAAESLREWLAGVNLRADRDDYARLPSPGWDAVTDRMLYGVFYGFSVAECLWGRDGRHITLDAVKVRDRRRFGFDGDMRLRLMTAEQSTGELLPARKFWALATGADHDDEPYGLGLGHWLYWPVFFKRNGLKFWLTFLEKFGQPTAAGKYPANATAPERAKLLGAVRAIQSDSGIILPEGMVIELLEAARSGTGDYTALHDRMNQAITKVTLGHTGSSEATPGKLGGEDMAKDVRQDLVKADADLVCDSFNRGPARWLTEWNYPGAAPPRVWRKIEDVEDLTQVAEREKKVFDMGFKPTLRHVTETYGGEWEVDATSRQAMAPSKSTIGSDQAAFAEAIAAPQPQDLLADRLAIEGQPAIDEWLETIEAMLGQAGSLEQFKELLLAAYGNLPTEPLALIMAAAQVAAEAAGRFDLSVQSD